MRLALVQMQSRIHSSEERNFIYKIGSCKGGEIIL